MSANFRHESFLLDLPFDAGLHHGFILHTKDEANAPREPAWESFDLQRYLGLDSPPVEGQIASTTLMFGVAERRVRPFLMAEKAWPSVFRRQRRNHPWPRRLLYSQPVATLRTLSGRPAERHSVVQAVRLAPRPNQMDDDWRFEQLRHALEVLNGFLLSVGTVHGDPEIRAVSLRELPPLVQGWGWDVDKHRAAPPSEEWQIYLTHDRLPGTPAGELTQPEADLATWLAAYRDHPVVPAGDFLQAAVQSAHRGQETYAVIAAGTGIELLISAALRIVAPHRAYGEPKLTNVIEGDFASKTKHHFAPLLGYDPEPLQSADAFGVWWRDGYELRNRVVHRGHVPAESEVHAAIGAAWELHNDVGSRLSADPVTKDELMPIPDQVWREAEQARKEREP